MASAFSVCALVENWREMVPSDRDEAHGFDVKDPNWYAPRVKTQCFNTYSFMNIQLFGADVATSGLFLP